MANTQKFKTVTTNLGRNAVAMAHATGSSIKLTHMAVGDGNGQSVEPHSAMTALVHEVYRGQINDIVINSEVQGEFTAELLIPQSTGGFFIREVALFFEDGTMFAIGNTPLTEKTELTSGAATDLLVRMIIRVLDAGTVEIFIDPAQVLATRDYVDRMLANHDQNENAHELMLGKHNKDKQAHYGTIQDVLTAKAQGQIIQAANINNATDLNTVVKHGKYYFADGMAGANKPDFNEFILEVVQSKNGKVKQFAYNMFSNSMKSRNFNGSAWNDWESIGNEPDIDTVVSYSLPPSGSTITAPDKGYFNFRASTIKEAGFVLLAIADSSGKYVVCNTVWEQLYPRGIAICIPVYKGAKVIVSYQNISLDFQGDLTSSLNFIGVK